MEICQNLWEWSIACDWSNVQTFVLEILAGIIIGFTITTVVRNYDNRRTKRRSSITYTKLRPMFAFLLGGLDMIERKGPERVLEKQEISQVSVILRDLLSMADNIENTVQIAHEDLEPDFVEDINSVISLTKVYASEIRENPHFYPPSRLQIQPIINQIMSELDNPKKSLGKKIFRW